jgi:chromosomal replication initiator protein
LRFCPLAAAGSFSIVVDGAAVVDAVFSIPLVANLPLGESDSEELGRAAEARHDAPRWQECGNREALGSEFLAGPENSLIAVAMAALLEDPEPRYNPLVIHGPSGTGKSHLARGLAAKRLLRVDAASAAIVFICGADFARLLHEAIEGETTDSFRRRFRGASLLILDELTQLATKRVAQQELIRTLDDVIAGGGQVVITSRAAPEQMDALSPALRSRLSAGLTASLVPPAAGARLALIERIASLRRIALPTAAARALADGLSGTAPELSGALAELQLQAEFDKSSIDASGVRRFLADRQLRLRPSLRTIASRAAKYFGLRMCDLKSSSRRRAVVQARGIAICLARQLTDKSLKQIGDYFGGRDHTTVLHSVNSTESRLRSDPTSRRAAADIRRLIAQA